MLSPSTTTLLLLFVVSTAIAVTYADRDDGFLPFPDLQRASTLFSRYDAGHRTTSRRLQPLQNQKKNKSEREGGGDDDHGDKKSKKKIPREEEERHGKDGDEFNSVLLSLILEIGRASCISDNLPYH